MFLINLSSGQGLFDKISKGLDKAGKAISDPAKAIKDAADEKEKKKEQEKVEQKPQQTEQKALEKQEQKPEEKVDEKPQATATPPKSTEEKPNRPPRDFKMPNLIRGFRDFKVSDTIKIVRIPKGNMLGYNIPIEGYQKKHLTDGFSNQVFIWEVDNLYLNDGRYGRFAMDMDGNILTPIVKFNFGRFDKHCCMVSKLAPTKVYGILYRTGVVAWMPKECVFLSDFLDGVAIAQFKTKSGYDEVIKTCYVNYYGKEIYSHLTKTNKEWGDNRPDFNGFQRDDYMKPLQCGLRAFKDWSSKLWGYLDSKGKIVIKPQFTQVSNFNEGYAVVGIPSSEQLATIASISKFENTIRPDKWSVINIQGKIVGDNVDLTSYAMFEPTFEYPIFCNGYAIQRNENKNSYYYIDTTGKKVGSSYYFAGDFSNGYAIVMENEDDKNSIVINTNFVPVGFSNRFDYTPQHSTGDVPITLLNVASYMPGPGSYFVSPSGKPLFATGNTHTIHSRFGYTTPFYGNRAMATPYFFDETFTALWRYEEVEYFNHFDKDIKFKEIDFASHPAPPMPKHKLTVKAHYPEGGKTNISSVNIIADTLVTLKVVYQNPEYIFMGWFNKDFLLLSTDLSYEYKTKRFDDTVWAFFGRKKNFVWGGFEPPEPPKIDICDICPECPGCPDDFCKKNPDDPMCKEVDFCEKYPNHPWCKEVDFCKKFPNHPWCKEDDFCEKNPDHPWCKEVDFCEKNPDHPWCKVDDFCKKYPDDPRCKEEEKKKKKKKEEEEKEKPKEEEKEKPEEKEKKEPKIAKGDSIRIKFGQKEKEDIYFAFAGQNTLKIPKEDDVKGPKFTTYFELYPDYDGVTPFGQNQLGILTQISQPDNKQILNGAPYKLPNFGYKMHVTPFRVNKIVNFNGQNYFELTGGGINLWELDLFKIAAETIDPITALLLMMIGFVEGSNFNKESAWISNGLYRVRFTLQGNEIVLGKLERFSYEQATWLLSDSDVFRKPKKVNRLIYTIEKELETPIPSWLFEGCRLKPSPKMQVQYAPPADYFPSDEPGMVAKFLTNLGNLIWNLEDIPE